MDSSEPVDAISTPRVPQLRTERLVLRGWRDEDLEVFAAMNADAEVMRHFPATLDRAASDELAGRIRERWADRRPSLWAVEVPGVAPFVGFVGLFEPNFDAPFTPAVEVGWRLARAHWGRGYAPEAAVAALRYWFEVFGLDSIVSFTVPANTASQRVMHKIGLRRVTEGDFDHPSLPPGHPMRRHVLYRVDRESWSPPSGAFDAATPGN